MCSSFKTFGHSDSLCPSKTSSFDASKEPVLSQTYKVDNTGSACIVSV